MRNNILFALWIPFLVVTTDGFAQQKIMQTGTQNHGIRDYREVMPGALYRGGANNGRAPLNRDQLNALCDEGLGTAIYLYNTKFPGPLCKGITRLHLPWVGGQGTRRRSSTNLQHDQKQVEACLYSLLEWYSRHRRCCGYSTHAVLQHCAAKGGRILESRNCCETPVSQGNPKPYELPSQSQSQSSTKFRRTERVLS